MDQDRSLYYANEDFIKYFWDKVKNREIDVSDIPDDVMKLLPGVTPVESLSSVGTTLDGSSISTLIYGNGMYILSVSSYTRFMSLYSYDAITWESPLVKTLSGGTRCTSSTYGNNVYVGVCSDGIVYSKDGLHWISTSSPIDCTNYGGSNGVWFTSVAYGNGMFVAVAVNTDKIAYSYDGIEWFSTTLSNPFSEHLDRPWRISLNSVIYSDGKFVAVGNRPEQYYELVNGTAGYYIHVPKNIVWSVNGIDWNWVEVNVRIEYYDDNKQTYVDSLVDVTYGNGKYVAVGSSSTCLYSDDGINWTRTTNTPFENVDLNTLNSRFLQVAYGNGMFVLFALRLSSYIEEFLLLRSLDGIEWHETFTPSIHKSHFMVGIIGGWGSGFLSYSNDRFILATAYGRLLSSVDGIEWTEIICPFGLVADYSDDVQYRYCGSTSYMHGRFYMHFWQRSYSYENRYTGFFSIYTNDFISWTSSNFDAESIIYDGKRFLAVGGSGRTSVDLEDLLLKQLSIGYSSDGKTWNISIIPNVDTKGNVCQLSYFDNKYFIVFGNDSRLLYSYDAVNWVSVQLPARAAYGNVYTHRVNNNDCLVYGPEKGYILRSVRGPMYSKDGIHWSLLTPSKSAFGIDGSVVAYGNGRFVMVKPPYIFYSIDGMLWNVANDIMDLNDPYQRGSSCIVFGNGIFVAIVYSFTDPAYVLYSTDGINWNRTTLPFSGDCCRLAYGNGCFVTIRDDSDEAAYSTDGITWYSSKLPTIEFWSTLVYGNGVFVCLSNSGVAVHSTDGIVWLQTRVSSSYGIWDALTYGDDKFVAILDRDRKAAYSYDGVTWYESTFLYSPKDRGCNSLFYVNDRFIALASEPLYDSEGNYLIETKIMQSIDGINWEDSGYSYDFPSNLNGIAYGDGVIMLTDEAGVIYFSVDGLRWSSETSHYRHSTNIRYGNGKFINFFAGGSAYSYDGLHWHVTENDDSTGIVLAYGGGTFLCSSYMDRYDRVNAYKCTTDGIDWNVISLENEAISQMSIYSDLAVYANGKFVVIFKERSGSEGLYSCITSNVSDHVLLLSGEDVTDKVRMFVKNYHLPESTSTYLSGSAIETELDDGDSHYLNEKYIPKFWDMISSYNGPRDLVRFVSTGDSYRFQLVSGEDVTDPMVKFLRSKM